MWPRQIAAEICMGSFSACEMIQDEMDRLRQIRQRSKEDVVSSERRGWIAGRLTPISAKRSTKAVTVERSLVE